MSDSGSTDGFLDQNNVDIDIKVKLTESTSPIPTGNASFSYPLPLTYGFVSTDAAYGLERIITTKKLTTRKFLSYGDRKLDLVAKVYSYSYFPLYPYGNVLKEISTKVAYKDMYGKEINIGKFSINSIVRGLNPYVLIRITIEDPFLKFLDSKGIGTNQPIQVSHTGGSYTGLNLSDLIEKGLNGKLADFLTLQMSWNNGDDKISFEPQISLGVGTQYLGTQYYTVSNNGSKVLATDRLNFKTPRFVMHKTSNGSVPYPPFVIYSSTFTEADYPEDKAIEYFFANFKFD